MSILTAIANSSGKIALNLRKSRFKLFLSSMRIPRDGQIVRILDAGGIPSFWEYTGLAGAPNIDIVVLNLETVISSQRKKYANIKCVIGNACDMKEFMDKEFDVVFSNSVIEHVGSFEDQKKMAGEIQRVGKMYFLQTPCFRFPLEPHFFTIGFQFLPLKAKAFLIRHFNLGWYPKERDYKKSINLASSIRLLRKYELKKLFTGGRIIPERFCGLTKSLIVYNNQS